MRSETPFDFRTTYNTDKLILKIVGVYPGSPDAETKSVLVYIKRVFGFWIWILFIISMFLFVFVNRSDAVKVSKTIFVCLTFICSLIKTINFIINIDKFSLLEDLLDNEIFYDQSYISMMQRNIEKTHRNMRVYKLLAVTTIIIYFTAMPFLANSDENTLPVSCYTPWDINKTSNYILTYLIQGVSTAIAGYLNIVTETLFATFCTIACAQLRALRANLEALDYSPSNLHIKRELIKNMVLHKQTIKLTAAIENVFSYGILGQFATAIVIICFAGFRLASPGLVEDDNFGMVTDLLGTFGHLVFTVGQVSIYCIYGHQIMVESSDINQAIYLSNWYMADLHVRKDLIVISECCKRPIILKAGKLLFLTVDSLVMILRASYSFFAVIRQMN